MQTKAELNAEHSRMNMDALSSNRYMHQSVRVCISGTVSKA